VNGERSAVSGELDLARGARRLVRRAVERHRAKGRRDFGAARGIMKA
jgi:hypothetical protein